MHEASRPQGEGNVPRSSRSRFASGCLAALMLCAPLAMSCGRASEARTLGPYTLAIKENTPAALQGEEGGVYQVTVPIALPLFEPPKGDQPNKVKPYSRGLWFTSSDVQIQVSYVITNFENSDITIQLLVDGWNEYIRYSPAVRIVDDDVVADRSCNDRLLVVPAKKRVEGRVSFDDFERIATALATVQNGAPNATHVMEPHTKLRESPLTRAFVPPVIAGLVGFDLSLRSSAKVKVAVEATVEIIDHVGVMVPKGEKATNVYPNRLTRFVPMAPAE